VSAVWRIRLMHLTTLPQLLKHNRLPLVWIAAVATLLMLGSFRALTGAEFALASAAIVPVYLVAWAGGFRHGLGAALLAAILWFISGLLGTPAHDARWNLLLNGFTRFLTYLLVVYLTARVRALLLQEAAAARRDPLTGLLNRRVFHEIGRGEVLRASRYHHPLAIAFVDLDRFKQLNDSKGHEVGDRALSAMGRALSAALRSTDCVARLGGDEFGIILPEIDQIGAAAAGAKLAAQINAALRPFAPVSASIGIAWFEYADGDFEALLKQADAVMYRIKRERTGGVLVQPFPSAARVVTAIS
jgi:diguanylate cyclase (GGDEF)-like protein